MSKQEVKYMYIRENRHPIATIAWVKDKDKDEWRMGLSVCSKHDKFTKATGRQLAYDRAKKGFDVFYVPHYRLDAITKHLLKHGKNLEEVRQIVRDRFAEEKLMHRTYPYVGEYIGSENIPTLRVFFTAPRTGYALNEIKLFGIEDGEYVEKWREDLFKVWKK